MYARMRSPEAISCLFLIVLLTLLLTASVGRNPARGASGPMPGVGLIRLGGGNWGTLTNTDKYSVMVASPSNANSAGALPGRALMTVCGVGEPPDSSSASCGVSYSDAVANGWLLKDSSGNYVKYPSSYSVLLDVGNTAYQQRFISAVDTLLRSHPGVDGMMIDNVVGSVITPSVKYPDSASYRAAMLSFIKAVGPALKAKGWWVAVNAGIYDPSIASTTGQIGDGSQWIWWVKQIASYVDGINLEHFQQNWDSTNSVRTSAWAWDGWQRAIGTVQGLGKQFYAGDFGSLSDVNKAVYLKASFLLDWNGQGGAFAYSDNWSGTSNLWNPAWMVDIGQPSAARFQVGVGWRRNFSAGTVIVNPNASSSQTFALGATYLTASGSSITSATLAPAQAMILRATTTTPTTTTTTTTPTTTTTTPTTTTTTTTPTTSNSTPTPQPGWTFCSWENTRCAFTGTMEVHYGANGKFTSPQTFTGGVDCNNSVFGDPVVNVRKWCEIRPLTTAQPGWTFCSWENTRCAFTGTMAVHYGANGEFTTPRNFTGGVDCNNSVFGDPSVNVTKRCEIRAVPTPQPGWTFCSWENTRCAFTGTMAVHYGANGKFTAPRNFTGGVDCNNSVFGDPLVNVEKWCEIQPVSTSTSTTTATAPMTAATSSSTLLPVNTSPPTVSGPALVGKLQKASTGTWSNSPTSFRYMWSRCDSQGHNCVTIDGATASTYETTSADSGRTLIVTVIAINAAGSALANSLPTSIIK
jgi:hypothetical protein